MTRLKGFVLLAFFGALLLVSGTCFASSASSCDQRIRTAEHRFHQAARRYGARSRQAQRRRQQLERVRNRCHM